MFATTLTSLDARKCMRDLGLWPDEKIMAQDEAWLRIAKYIDPDVRRDIVGWMKAADAGVANGSPTVSLKQMLFDYLRGAAAVIDPFPRAPVGWEANDARALRKDASAIARDIEIVAVLVRELMREHNTSVRIERQPAKLKPR